MGNGELKIESLPENIKLEEDEKPKKQYTPEQMVKHLWKVIEATNRAVESLHIRLNSAASENAMLVQQRDKAIENMNNKDTAMNNAIRQHTKREASIVEEIRNIHNRVSSLGGNRLQEIASDVIEWREEGRPDNPFAEHTEWLLQTIAKFKKETR